MIDRTLVPWWARIAAKLVLARLPIPYATWQRLGVFRHGAMDEAGYSMSVVDRHRARSGLEDLRGRTVLELGPGDSLATAVIVRALGGRAVLVDAGAFAPDDPAPYRRLAEHLRATGLQPPDLDGARSLADVLAACGAEYHSDGLAGLRRVPTGTVDLVFSHAVLEHVRHHELRETLQELNRVLVGTGASSHTVDLRDHLGGGLANLRFPRRIWESRAFVGSGFYTNRVSLSEFRQLFAETHADVRFPAIGTWDAPPIPRRRIAREFRARDDRDLMARTFDVVMRRRGAAV